MSYVPGSYLSESYRSRHSLSGRTQPSPQVLRVDRAKAKRWLDAHGRSTVDASRGAAIALFFTKKVEPEPEIWRKPMNIPRRQLALSALAMGLMGVAPVLATEADEEGAVAKQVEAFRAAQFAANAKALDALCAPELSYSHSDGRVEDKATFVANATSGKSKFLSLAYEDVKVRVVGTAAVVRFHWVGESESVADGKKNATNLHILMNWQKQAGDWKLLSRASTKL